MIVLYAMAAEIDKQLVNRRRRRPMNRRCGLEPHGSLEHVRFQTAPTITRLFLIF